MQPYENDYEERMALMGAESAVQAAADGSHDDPRLLEEFELNMSEGLA